ncbi:amino acid adenylation domain-containing protein [Streptomyces sp. NPDC094468]|uniref:non-ribosomal peptide synthetase n=1 Tax=Streptomyces sp. NPDC094468 TaxID=3366066 RepID=UPI0037F7AC70
MANSSGFATENSTLTTVLPRWPSGRHSGEAAWGTYEVKVPVDVHRAISAMESPLAILAAAYVKVASILTGERNISVGYRSAECGQPRLLQVTVEEGPWLSLTGKADQALRDCGGYPAGGHLSERTVPAFETVLDVTGWTGRKSTGTDHDGAVLVWGFDADGDAPLLWLTYRTDFYGEDCITRYAGYYVHALELLVRNPAGEHNEHSLVSPDELDAQLREFSGPVAGLPEQPFHELFSAQAARTPGALAVKYGDRECTYRELDQLASRIAHSLLKQGIATERVVAVNLQRSVEWVAAIIGVMRAGGVYLPVDPDWPADRLRAVLKQAKPQVLLVDQVTENIRSATADSLDDAPRILTIGTAEAEPADGDPRIHVSADQLAYIYFTSGSTGEPKGAMCEHAGMMNHLLAKLEDLDITTGDMLIQSAPATFDISLWQAIAPLLVGAATTVMSADTVRDIDDFIGEAENVGATVIQVVPSYLEMLTARLSEIEPARRLPEVRHVVVTGEALKKGLVERWFELCDIPLTNAYGATEASDDTTHHVMHRPPVSTSVPVGKPVRNVQVLIVDEKMQVVPLGAPGEIAFAGVCVGRGYVNDESRTAAAFVESPIEPTLRMYRTGDYGRWGQDGVLEFLGRRDEQIKVRGFRVEIGEIENAMLRIDGVRDAAVVVKHDVDTDAGLVGFYTSTHVVEAESIRGTLAEVLPEYMIPPHLYRLSSMPLTDNSKIDKKALMNEADNALRERTEGAAPQTATEQMLAGLWAELLGLSDSSVGRNDDFFERGGSSLSAIRLVVKLGKQVSLLDIANSPVLSDLAAVIDAKLGEKGQQDVGQ